MRARRIGAPPTRAVEYCGIGLSGHLGRLCASWDRRFLTTDPITLPRLYDDPADREVAAFLAAALSYGRVEQIKASGRRLLSVLGDRPARALRQLDPKAATKALAGFAHRFNDARDAALLLHFTSQMLRGWGSIEGFFLEGDDSSSPDIGPGLTSFTDRALGLDCTPWYRSGRLPASAGVRFFFPSPRDGSACKRLAMFLRWVVRPEDGIDLGLWKGIRPTRLVVPLDTHVSRIACCLGLTGRRTTGWASALEVTDALRRFDADDPVRFDFALCRLGMLTGFPARWDGDGCPLCAAAQPPASPAAGLPAAS